MTTNNMPLDQAALIPELPPAPDTANIAESKEKREITAAERLLLPAALVVAILYDRLSFAAFFGAFGVFGYGNGFSFASAFWLCYIVILYAFYWKKLARNRILWYVTGCCAALCVWNFFPAFTISSELAHRNIEFSMLTYLVIPAVLMAHAQFLAGDYKLKDVGKIAVAWLLGWIIKPFSGIPAFFGAAGSLVSGGNKSAVKKAALGVGITLPLLCVIIPLLCGADRVFGYYLAQFVGNWNFTSLFIHTVVVAVACILFYSFLWNIGFGIKEKVSEKAAMKIDAIISCIVLGSVSLLYVMFCAVQFTYLFAGAGLPDGMTYSEYAREGFAQTVVICAINLLLFGIFMQFGRTRKAVTGFLTGLLGLTVVMLFSGFIRLKLYIDAYGLTWLRLLSAWFVIYLAVVIVLCGVRMLREKLPAIALCALILLGWYVALGYSNPNMLVERYNKSHSYDIVGMR